jgi:hypothetical protein
MTDMKRQESNMSGTIHWKPPADMLIALLHKRHQSKIKPNHGSITLQVKAFRGIALSLINTTSISIIPKRSHAYLVRYATLLFSNYLAGLKLNTPKLHDQR